MEPILQKKIFPLDQLVSELQGLQAQGKKAVFTNGCFDLMHVGHTRYLTQARKSGDLLIVGLNSDASIARLKGPKRPLVPLDERLEMLANFWFIDFVIPFEEDTPLNLITALQPDLLVKGGDWSIDSIVGREVVEAKGGRVFNIPLVEGRSTTNLIEKIAHRYGNAAQS